MPKLVGDREALPPAVLWIGRVDDVPGRALLVRPKHPFKARQFVADDLVDRIPVVARNFLREAGDINGKALGSEAHLQQLGEPDGLFPR